MSRFEELEVWKKSHDMVLEVYKIIDSFPSTERYGLADQLRRAVTSIPLNICEGSGRNSDKEFKHFLYIARGSLDETKYILLLARDLKYIEANSYLLLLDKCDEVGRMINSFVKRL